MTLNDSCDNKPITFYNPPVMLVFFCTSTMWKRALCFNHTPFPLNLQIRYEGPMVRLIYSSLYWSSISALYGFLSVWLCWCVCFLSPASARLHVSADGYSCTANIHTHTHRSVDGCKSTLLGKIPQARSVQSVQYLLHGWDWINHTGCQAPWRCMANVEQ